MLAARAKGNGCSSDGGGTEANLGAGFAPPSSPPRSDHGGYVPSSTHPTDRASLSVAARYPHAHQTAEDLTEKEAMRMALLRLARST